jgi:arylsulfatase A-like enzyme
MRRLKSQHVDGKLSDMGQVRDRFRDFNTRVDEHAPDALTMPQFFMENGYYTASLGKIFHHRDDMEEQGWSEPEPHLPFHAPKRYWDLYDREAEI